MHITTARKARLFKLVNFWPPFVGAGIRIKNINPAFDTIDVEMKLHFWNQNYVGTHFGGSLYAMTDPFFMMILMEKLGPKYLVWDKAATIHFKRPGRGRVRARFHVSADDLNAIRTQADTLEKYEPHLHVEIVDAEGQVVATVEKVLSVRQKAKAKPYQLQGGLSQGKLRIRKEQERP